MRPNSRRSRNLFMASGAILGFAYGFLAPPLTLEMDGQISPLLFFAGCFGALVGGGVGYFVDQSVSSE